jgi:hypothetical protein
VIGQCQDGLKWPRGPLPNPSVDPVLSFSDAQQQTFCQRAVEASLAVREARRIVQEWQEPWAQWTRDPLVPHRRDAIVQTSFERQETDIQWAAILILSANALPVAYGVLGVGAAVVRGLSEKMRANLLSPRDLYLSFIQMFLGAVIGGCIGLFVATADKGASATTGLIGSIPLSASALCFIAGFGVEGVFVALQRLINRVFNLPK